MPMKRCTGRRKPFGGSSLAGHGAQLPRLAHSVAGKWVARVTRSRELPKRLSLLAPSALPVPPGESPGGTGQWPVLPQNEFPDTLSGDIATTSKSLHFIRRANKNRNGF